MTSDEKIKRIKGILHSPRGKNHAPKAYDSLMTCIIKIDKSGDITNHDLNAMRRILDQLGEVDEVLNESVRSRNT